MKHKIAQNEYLQQLLLSTGDALLIDCCGMFFCLDYTGKTAFSLLLSS